MKQIKVSEASGVVLDWLVAKSEGDKLFRARLGRPDDWDGATYRAGNTSDERWVTRVQVANVAWFADYTYNPAANWAQGGPIIEREEIGLKRNAPCSDGRQWEASPSITAKGAGGKYGYGPTPLIAAMRCYVVSRLGGVVEVPDELL